MSLRAVPAAHPGTYHLAFRSSLACLTGQLRATREYDRTIAVPNGKKSIEQVIQQIAVELKADTIRILDRAGSSQPGESTQQPANDDVHL